MSNHRCIAGLNPNNSANYIKKVELTADVDRRKASIEVAEVMHDLCAAKKALLRGKFSKEDGAILLDEMILGMSKLNEYITKFDIIKFY